MSAKRKPKPLSETKVYPPTATATGEALAVGTAALTGEAVGWGPPSQPQPIRKWDDANQVRSTTRARKAALARALHAEGKTVEQIIGIVKRSRRTVEKYLAERA